MGVPNLPPLLSQTFEYNIGRWYKIIGCIKQTSLKSDAYRLRAALLIPQIGAPPVVLLSATMLDAIRDPLVIEGRDEAEQRSIAFAQGLTRQVYRGAYDWLRDSFLIQQYGSLENFRKELRTHANRRLF